MRHLFVVYSGITRLAAQATAEFLGLRSEETVVLVGRDEAEVPGVENLLFVDQLRLGRNAVRFRYELRKFDRLIDRVAADAPLSVYLPGLFTEHFYALATHPRVSEVNFIEEGTSSLTTQTRRYARRRGGSTRMANLAAWRRFPAHLTDCSDLVGEAFHFTPEAFPDWPSNSRLLLPWPRNQQTPELADLGALVSVEAVVEAGHATLDEYATTVAYVVDMLANKRDMPTAIKFHGNVNATNERRITSVVQSQVPEARVIPREFPLELLFGPDGPLLVGAVTSSLHYAVLAGGSAETYVDLLASPTLTKRFANLVAILPRGSRQGIRYFEP